MTTHNIPVVLLHGLGRTPNSMRPLAWRLGRAGFRAEVQGYPSTRMRVAEAIAHVREVLGGLSGPFHVVGHSLGGLIGARLLREGELGIARVVQLGSPNLGSPVAERLGGVWPFSRLCGPALEDLGPHGDVPPPHEDIAAIAGTRGPKLAEALERPHDGAVSRASAWAGAGHRAEVPAVHTLLPLSRAAGQMTVGFLATGRIPEVP